MKTYEKEMIDVLHALEESKILSQVVIAGSWAMLFYKEIFENFTPRIETTDLDLYLPNPKSMKGEGVYESFNAHKYLSDKDCLTGKTKFYSQSGFEIEFLTIPDRTMSQTIRIPGLNLVAEALPKMAPAGWDYIQVEYHQMTVNVVSPVSFVLQKLLINSERKPEYKKEKDIDSIKYVLPYILASKKYSTLLRESLNNYPRKWRKVIVECAAKNNIKIDY